MVTNKLTIYHYLALPKHQSPNADNLQKRFFQHYAPSM